MINSGANPGLLLNGLADRQCRENNGEMCLNSLSSLMKDRSSF